MLTPSSSCLPGGDPQVVLDLCIAQGIGGGTPAFLPAEKSPERQDFDVQSPQLGTRNVEAETS